MNKKQGFTLVELLVVVGIIAILSGALIFGLGNFARRAQKAKCQEVVSNAATALALCYQHNQKWPSLVQSTASGGAGRLKEDVAAQAFIAKRSKSKDDTAVAKLFMSVTYDKTAYRKDGTRKLIGADRCGIVTPWATDVLKKRTGGNGEGKNLSVPSGKKVQDHILYYAVDLDDDGITEANVNGSTLRIRATAVTWSAGADGELDSYSNAGRSDDVYSWNRGQIDRK